MSVLDRYAIHFQKLGLREWHGQLTDELDKLRSAIGGLTGFIDDSASAAHKVAVPPAATFEVIGIDGKFVTFVTNPQVVQPSTAMLASLRFRTGINAQNTGLLHNLQSATDLNFAQSSNLKDYGTSTQLMWTDQDANVTRFFRLRSSYDGKTWNAWQVYGNDTVTCGPVGVWSGVLRTAALAFTDSVAMTADGSIAISQSGTSTTILIAGKTWNVGTDRLTYLGGSVDPGAYGTYYIYGIDTQKQGGAITYLATQNLGDLASQDGIIQFGTITTVNTGGGSGGHGGFCPVGEVLVEMMDGSRKPASEILEGDVLRAPDGGPEEAQADAELIPAQPAFSFTLENGNLFRGASSPELIRSNGHWVRLVDLAAGDVVDTMDGQFKVKEKTYLGERSVYRLQLPRTKRFIGDRVILHNMKGFTA